MQPGDHNSSPLSVELPASMENWDDLFGFVQSEVHRCLGGHAKEYNLLLACEELLSNMIRYSSGITDEGSPVTIRILSAFVDGASPETYQLQISDNGAAFDPRFDDVDCTIAEVPINCRQIGGLGLFLVKSSVDRIVYRYLNHRNLYLIETLLNS